LLDPFRYYPNGIEVPAVSTEAAKKAVRILFAFLLLNMYGSFMQIDCMWSILKVDCVRIMRVAVNVNEAEIQEGMGR